MPPRIVPISFPLGGVAEQAPYAGQSGPVAVRADNVLNVRPHDALERRARGGQRTGIERYLPEPVNGALPIQALGSGVRAFDAGTLRASDPVLAYDVGDRHAVGEEIQASSDWDEWVREYYNPSDTPDGSGQIKAAATLGETWFHSDREDSAAPFLIYNQALVLGEKYVLQAKVIPPGRWFSTTSNAGAFAFMVRLDVGAVASSGSLGDYLLIGWASEPTTNNGLMSVQAKYSDRGSITVNGGIDFGSPFDVELGVEHEVELQVNGDGFKFSVDGATVGSFTTATYAGNSDVGLYLVHGNSFDDNSPYVRDFRVSKASSPVSLYTTDLIAVSGGSVFAGDRAGGLSQASGGGNVFQSGSLVRLRPAFQDVFFVTGEASDYRYMPLSSKTVKSWSDDLTAGALPVGSGDPEAACRMIALYRGRVVLAGLREEPQNWFMSRAGDPFDWDYSPATTDALQAVAGNNSNAGELGDVLTALIPFQDDLLFMGGDHTLWVMRGDPAAGGKIDNISRQVGVVGPEAWAFDTGGVLYFFGQNGLYRVAAGGAPQLLSRGKLDRRFADIDTAANAVRLVYDREWQGVHTFITPLNEPRTPVDHWFWDQRTDSFWRDRYPTAFGPTAVHLFDADDPDDRAVLLGGFDGRLRRFSADALDDDGAAITSFVRFPLIHPALPMGQFQLSDVQVHLDAGGAASGAMLHLYRGRTPGAAATVDTPVFSRAITAGRNVPSRRRVRANALQFELVNDAAGETWAYEDGAAVIRVVGRQRAKLPA